MSDYLAEIHALTVKGEQALWRAVITQALMDASNHSKKMEMRYEKSQALCWLTGFSDDFRMVCENAGLDPVYVRKESIEALKRDCQWRAPAQSKPDISENIMSEKELEPCL